jgi:glycosyltransferase involved in cell wall biosynthesis
VPTLIDAHHLGQGQTGNETWARNVVAELAGRPSGAHIAVTAASRAVLGSEWTVDRVHQVSSSSTVRLARDLPRLTRRLRPDALLVQYTLPPFALSRVPGVVMVHDLSFERPEAAEWIPAASLVRYRATIRRSVRRARIVLVPTEWTRRDVVETYGIFEDRVLVAGNAVDTSLGRYLESGTRPTGAVMGAAPATVLAVGTVLPRKNLSVVARAVQALRSDGMAVRLRVVGPVPAAGQTTARELRSALGDGLDLVGPVTAARLAEEYLAADVLAFPSLFEGFGIPLVEAMAAGLPVVSSTSSCLPEVGGDAVSYADPTDADAWGSALSRVLEDGAERARLAAAGLARAETFSWSHTADVVEQALAAAAG